MNVPNHETRKYTGIVLERISRLAPGGKMRDLPEHLQHKSFVRIGEKKTGGPNLRLLRLEQDKPSLTVTAYIFNKFVHPVEDRYITPREAAVLQDFPIDYAFKGNLGQVQKQIGNAVPVGLAKALAQEVAKYFKRLHKCGEIKIASYFCGAGGFDLGFEQASNQTVQFRTGFSTDIEECAGATIKQNRPAWNFHRADIRDMSPTDVIALMGATPDVIIGGPPCQPFSVAGKQKATHDPLGSLYTYYINHVRVLQPEIVLMENVYGLAQVKSADMVAEIYRSFQQIGYAVNHRELMAADYGVPQKRRRLFFVAAKHLHYFNYPQPTHCRSENLLGLPVYRGAGEALNILPRPVFRNMGSTD